ncbi:beta-galactosidase [Acidithrix ferrooxidans]|uniref:Beta-galactosidase n=1 Tax=Acidithrix ferrooxidans TaxID=1280514 RepID=A0A0D8HL69_9ACTN|nr:beta-galactosidase [Acidithrix ferrooxidans]KJF18750.1 beta-galactosidase bgaB [Acidithrix ferrooxidans]
MTVYSERLSLPLGRPLYFGGDYNPEQWSRDVWQQDVEMMVEAGVNLVTLGVFSWSRLQSAPGKFDFGWMDEIFELLSSNGIMVDLATATASPPPWLVHAHPEILPRDFSGRTLSFGSRQSYCPNSRPYRDAAAELVHALAQRYGSHSALEMWHINNEYGCHVTSCYCDVCEVAFREWLVKRYVDIAGLNFAWGTTFWSQIYTDWNQVTPPRIAPTFSNPTQQLDYARFSSDSLLDCLLEERAILREVTPQIPVTTNFMGFFKGVDQFKWAEALDFCAVDNYPDPASPTSSLISGAVGDLTRSVGQGRPWILMEQAPSAVNWREINAPKAPGQNRALSMSSIARGANGVMYFQWRAAKAGAEKFHSAMVPHSGRNSRVWRETVRLGNDLKALGSLGSSQTLVDVAILFDWDNWWAIELDSHPSTKLSYPLGILDLYRSFARAGRVVDFVHPGSDLSRYKVVVAANLYLVKEDASCAFVEYVQNGGVGVVTYFSGIVDENDHVYLGGYPGLWRELLGIEIEEFSPLAIGESVSLKGEFLQLHGGSGQQWSDSINLVGAEVLVSFGSGRLEGMPAITKNAFGSGKAYYVSTSLDPDTWGLVLTDALSGHEEIAIRPSSEDVEIVNRGNLVFIINHGLKTNLSLEGDWIDVLTKCEVSGELSLEQYDVYVLYRLIRE